MWLAQLLETNFKKSDEHFFEHLTFFDEKYFFWLFRAQKAKKAKIEKSAKNIIRSGILRSF